MATISNRLTSTGNLLVNGTIDEITYTANKVTANTVFAAQFDEVTYNTVSPAIKNLNTYTQQFTDASWTKQRATISAVTASAPDGSSTIYKLVSDLSASTTHYSFQGSKSVIAGTNYVFSIYAKSAEYTGAYIQFYNTNGAYTTTSAYFNLSTGTVTTSSGSVVSVGITSVGNGWYRIWLASTALITVVGGNVTFQLSTDGSNGSATFTGDGTSGTYFWGAQYEVGSTPTIYQPVGAANTLVASTTVRKIDQAANYYIQGQFDELTGAPVIDGNLKFWIDAAQSNSYSGSGATWYDISTSQSNVTLYNSPTYSSSVTGGNIKFTPSSTQYGDTATNLGNMPLWTAEAWVKVNASLTGQVTSAVTNQYNLSNALNYSIGTNKAPTDYNLCVGFFDGAWHNTTGFVPTLDTWYQVVGTYDGTTLTQYVNGTANGSAVSYTGTASSGGNTRIARRWDDTTVSTNLFPGDIAVVRIYNRALTADEVSQNFNAHRRRFNL